MKRYYILLSVFAFFFTDAAAYKYAVDSIPVELRENTNAVIRTRQMVYTVISPGKATARYKAVTTLMNESADDQRIVLIHYDGFSSLQNIRAASYDSEGRLIEVIAPSKILDISSGSEFISDDRYKRIAFPVNRYPFTIEVEYEKSINGQLSLPLWDFFPDPSVSVQESAVQYVVPVSIPFRYREYNLKSKADKAVAVDKYVYSWVEKDIPAVKKWYFSPLRYARRPVLLAAIDDFELNDRPGSMRSWQSLGQWVYDLNQGLDILPDEEKARIRQIVSGISDDREKAKALYKYMQSRTRYISIQLGIGGLRPAPAEVVSEKGYGDCKALSNYMYAILKEAGIKSYYTLIKAEANRNIVPTFVSNQFNHAILCVPFSNDTVWLECTSQTLPFNFLGDFTCDRYALLVTPTGGKMVRTPAIENSYYETTGKVELKRNEPSVADLSEKASGLGFDAFHGYYLNESGEEIIRSLNESRILGTFSIDAASYIETHDEEPWSVLSYKATLRDLAVTDGSGLHFRPCLEPFEYQPFDTIGLRIYDRPVIRDSIVYKLPEGYRAEFIPVRSDISSPYGKYRYEVRVLDKNNLLFVRERKLARGIYEGEEARKFFSFLNSTALSDHQIVLLTRESL